MDKLIEIHNRLIGQLGNPHSRDLENHINWDHRLIVLKGARGVGKTTLLLKHISEKHRTNKQCLYMSLDNLYFANNSLIDLVDSFYKKGGRLLFLDEVHKLSEWSRHVKNIYDSYPKVNMVVTGSSM